MRKLMFVLSPCWPSLDAAGRSRPRRPPRRPPPAEDGGYSQGVKDYYGDGDAHPETEPGSIEDVEAEYHQPPQPAEAGLGETITLTGTNIGVRLRVTVTGVERVDDHQAVQLELESTGIANYDGEFTQAAVTYADGTTQPLAKGANAPCSNTLDLPTVFIAVGAKTTGLPALPDLRIRVADALPTRARDGSHRGRRDLEPRRVTPVGRATARPTVLGAEGPPGQAGTAVVVSAWAAGSAARRLPTEIRTRKPTPTSNSAIPTHDREQRDSPGEERHVQRGGERGLGHPDLASGIADRRARFRVLGGRGLIAGALAVVGRVLRHLRIGLAARGLQRVDAHVVREALGFHAGVDLLARDRAARGADAGQAGFFDCGGGELGRHVRRADELLVREFAVDVPAARQRRRWPGRGRARSNNRVRLGQETL